MFKKMETQKINPYIYLVLFLVMIALLSFTIVYLIKNVELIKSDAIVFGMKQHNFNSCMCKLPNGQTVSFGDIKILNING